MGSIIFWIIFWVVIAAVAFLPLYFVFLFLNGLIFVRMNREYNRDSRYFLSKGFNVEACDGSAQMVKIAEKTAGIPVKQMLFDELSEVERYDGIFACASILHVPFKALPDIFRRLKRAVKRDGIIYVSFKYGDYEGERNGRYFTDLTEERLKALLQEADPVAPLSITDLWITGDARPGRESENWLNAILGCNAPQRS